MAVNRGITARKPATPAEDDGLLARALHRFSRGKRLSVEHLAADLGISRATAYRRAGNGDRLVGEVIARLAESTFRRALGEARGRGADRVVSMMERGMRMIIASEP